MKLYDLELSGNSYKVRLLLSLLKVEYEIVPVNLLEGEHKQEPFLSLNPKGEVPVLEDGDFLLADSQAILVYLAEKLDRTDWYPEDARLRAEIQSWFSFAVAEITRGPEYARLAKLFNIDVDYDATVVKSEQALRLLNNHLAEREWLVGDKPTIADVAMFPYVALSGDGEISLEPYTHVQAWLERFKALPNFTAMPGIEVAAAA